MVGFVILTLLKLEPMARNQVQTHTNSAIDLPVLEVTTTTTTMQPGEDADADAAPSTPKSETKIIDSSSLQDTAADAEPTNLTILPMIILSIIVITKMSPPTRHISWQSMQAQFCTSLILHFQGLMTLQRNDGRALAMMKGAAGAGLEGIFLQSLIITLLSKRRLWASGLVCILSIVSIMVLYSTVTFMKKTGSPSEPDMFVVISGLREARSFVEAEGVDDLRGMIKGLFGAYGCALPSSFLVWRIRQGQGRDNNDNDATVANKCRRYNVNADVAQRCRRRQCILYFSMLFMALLIVYCSGAWAPIFHVYASICGSFVFSPPGSSGSYINIVGQTDKTHAAAAPNLILLVHESLSGQHTMTRKETVKLMPFLQKKFQSNDGDFFVFENARTVSGDTTECIPAIVSGCLPVMDDKRKRERGKEIAHSTNMATQAKARGYQTLSFTSRALNMKGTKWFMVEDALSINFDQVWHPGVTGEPHVNEAAQSDRLMGQNFKNWIQEWSQNNTLLESNDNATKTPFFAQFYYFDAHHPYYSENKTSNRKDRLDGMLMTVDKGIEDIFKYLNDVGELNNTIVIASGDHGDTYQGGAWTRLFSWDAGVLHPLMYMYIPKSLSTQNPELVRNLNHNRQQVVSTLDLFPTMLHVLDGISSNSKNEYDDDVLTDGNCIRGHDLLSKKIDSERIAWSFSSAGRKKGNWGIHYKRSTLVNHFGWPKHNGLKVVSYDKTVGSVIEKQEEEEDDVLTMDEWKSFVLTKAMAMEAEETSSNDAQQIMRLAQDITKG